MLNLTKASMLIDFMFTKMGLNLTPKMFTPKPDKDGVPKPSTAMEHMLAFEEVPEAKAFVSVLKKYSQADKAKSTYVDGFMEFLRPDGRLHPWYFMYKGNKANEDEEGGTTTGRLSAKRPAFQVMVGET